MNRRPRSISFGSVLALAAVLVAGAGRTADAQVYDYAVHDVGQGGALGSALARIGDIDSDGYEDFVVGEPNWVSGEGRALLVAGNHGFIINYIYGNALSHLGAAVEGRIDLDGDGFQDVLFGAPLDNTVNIDAGMVGAYSPHRNVVLFNLFGGKVLEQFGSSIRSLQGDVDSDGIEDFIVGSPGADLAYVFSSGTKLALFINSGQSGAGFGTDVCRGGDLDGDGVVDYVVGSPDYVDSGGTKTGRVTAFSGKNGNKLWSVDGAADSKFGKALAAPGDFDNDGVLDIAVGAPQHLDSSGKKTGCVTVLSGANQSVLYKAFGDNANDTFGHDVHGVGGDIDNDGTVDFIVGAPQRLGSDVGYARTISGANGNTIWTYDAANDPNKKNDYGDAVAGGDFDNDGRTDVVIGGTNYGSGDGIVEVWTTSVANWNNYGSGWPGTNGVPSFKPRANPIVGKSLKIDLDNSAGVATAGLLLLSGSSAFLPTGKGGTILVFPSILIPLSLPAGGLTLSGQIPDDPSLFGLDLYMQVLEIDAGASKGLSFTRGLDLHFGAVN